MSLLTLIKAQLGLSNTPANNFTLDASADNGTLKLARGNAGATTQDILTVDATGVVRFPQNPSQSIVAFTSATRVPGTTYTNSSGLPITVMVSMSSTAANASITGSLDGNTIRGSEASVAGVPAAITMVVPNGASYSLNMNNGTATVHTWLELR